jgi:hypothetical protein
MRRQSNLRQSEPEQNAPFSKRWPTGLNRKPVFAKDAKPWHQAVLGQEWTLQSQGIKGRIRQTETGAARNKPESAKAK